MIFNNFTNFLETVNKFDKFTVQRGRDGFGSQFLAKIIGYCISRQVKSQYYYSEFIDLATYVVGIFKKEKTNDANELLSQIMNNLNIRNIKEKNKNETCLTIKLPYGCIDKNTFSNETLKNIQSAWPIKKPDLFNKYDHNICVHIREGLDVQGNHVRKKDPHFYEEIIKKLLIKFPKSHIHIISWGSAKINHLNDKNITHHQGDGQNDFIDDFNKLIHADILLLSNSTFSVSAGFFNKNTVLYSKEIFSNQEDLPPSNKTPVPFEWEENFKKIFSS